MSKKAGDGVDVLEAEQLDDLAERPHLDAVGRAPAEQGQVVDHRLGQDAPGAEVRHGDGVLALRQLLALLVDEDRQVGEGSGARCADGRLDQQVLRACR